MKKFLSSICVALIIMKSAFTFSYAADVESMEYAQTNLINKMKSIQDSTMNKYGIIKYDAFDDVGGKLSFALAMLDKNDTGIVLNAVHSRDNCFLYIKEIMKGESYIMLSEEEVEALRIAKASRD